MATILVAAASEGDRATVRELLSERADWRCLVAATADEALALLDSDGDDGSQVDLVLAELEFGNFGDDTGFFAQLRARRPLLPVVLITSGGSGGDDAVFEALRRGAVSYVPRSALAKELSGTVGRVLSLCQTAEPPAGILGRRVESRVTFELENDARLFPPLVAYLQDELERFGLVQGDERVFAGVAIEEALMNGMIHGNLELEGTYRDAGFRPFEKRLEEKRRMSPFKERRLELTAELSHDEASITIRDEGKGFDTSSVPDPLAPENRWRSSGRGILLMRTFMDEVEFNDKGNEVRLVKRRKKMAEASSDS